jgi:hypothetical protein
MQCCFPLDDTYLSRLLFLFPPTMYYIPLLKGRTRPGAAGATAPGVSSKIFHAEHRSITALVIDTLPPFRPEHCSITGPSLASFLGPPLLY